MQPETRLKQTYFLVPVENDKLKATDLLITIMDKAREIAEDITDKVSSEFTSENHNGTRCSLHLHYYKYRHRKSSRICILVGDFDKVEMKIIKRQLDKFLLSKYEFKSVIEMESYTHDPYRWAWA